MPWNGIINVPHCFADDIWVFNGCQTTTDDILSYRGVRVIAIHPVHFFLNSAGESEVSIARNAHWEVEQFLSHVNDGYGSRSFVIELFEKIEAR